MIVIKRDGTPREFSGAKIKTALEKTNTRTHEMTNEDIDRIIGIIENKCLRLGANIKIDVEKIQDIVEDTLLKSKFNQTAKSYILYRDLRTQKRGSITDKTFMEFLSGKSDYWNNENSNKDAKVVTTQRDYLAGIASTDLARRFLLSSDVCKAHDAGIIHQHDMDYMAQRALTNCFSSTTRFITSSGIKSFDECYEGEVVKVLDKDGIWRLATVHQYGKQKLYDVTFALKRASTAKTKVVSCTANHRWILKDGTVTTELKVGDVLYRTLVDTDYTPETQEEYDWFCFGMIIGDGSDIVVNGNFYGTRIRLCGNKTKYAGYFDKADYQVGANEESDRFTDDLFYHNKNGFSKQEFLSTSAWKYLPHNLKVALFQGLYAADGYTNTLGIATADRRIAKLIQDISALAGYHIQRVIEQLHDTNFKKDALLITFNFLANQDIHNKNAWRVIDIQPHLDYTYVDRLNQDFNVPLNVWCVEEPITHSFTLEGGIVTGNCCLVNLEDMLMNGTVINGVKIEPQHRLLTAVTVATQVITAVASSQYGGTTITLTHLAPFVRMSLEKYVKEVTDELAEINYQDKATLINKIAHERLGKEVTDAVQTFNYQINSMSTTNGQAPFLSVEMFINENPEYSDETAMLIEEFLKQRIQGMKNEKGIWITPAFPKLLYVLDDNNITETSKYWYLTELAAKCTAKRMVPDYISAKVLVREKYGIDRTTGLVVPGYESILKARLLDMGFSESEIDAEINKELQIQRR